jgi:oligosaccharide repeat unit polymerase
MIFILIAIILLVLLNKFFDIKNLFNPFVFFFIYHTVFLFIALSYREIYPIEISDEVIALITSSYCLTFIGAIISRFFFQSIGINYVRLHDIFSKKESKGLFFFSSLLIFSIGVICYLYFIYKSGGIIIFGEDVEDARISKRKGLGLVTLLYISFLIYGYLGMLLSKIKLFNIIKIPLFAFTVFALISYGSRAPALKLILGIFILGLISKIKKGHIMKIKQFVTPFIIILLLIVILGALRKGVPNSELLDLVLARAGWRPFVNIQNFQKIFEFFPSKHDFLYGYSMIVDLKLFLPGSNLNFGTLLKEIMNWKFEGGSITPSYIGLGYLNFGIIGVFVYALLYGFILNFIYEMILIVWKKNNFTILFLFLLSIGMAGAVSTGLLGVLINNVMFLVFILLVHLVLYHLLKVILK